jgi:nucleotide-binding universal stress UspA family protein
MFETIVIGYDETESSKRALERAAELTQAFGAKLVVTSVAPILIGAGRSAGPTDPTDPVGKHLQELVHARSFLAERKIEAEFAPAVGEPADTIVEVAEEHKADLIVVGTREPNILERLLGQSVSQAVSHKAHSDVLIVH